MMENKQTPNLVVCVVGILLILSIIFTGLLAFDLANRGLVWEFAWSVTGEEEPVGQIRGVVQWIVGHRRPYPNTAPMIPINHTNVNPYGINTFLEQEVDRAKVDAQIEMISEAGFQWIRQQFVWEDIEVDGRGQFTDTRNDLNGDGVYDDADTINAWDKYDYIVDVAEQYGLGILARLDNPPEWSRSDSESADTAPPDDIQDFVNFAVAVAERYQGRIRYFQVWNEPNLTNEWGFTPVEPERYTELLCRTYDALKAVDPTIVVLTGALAPTVDLSGFNLMDFVFLQRMYDAGAGECFDILSAQGYGLWSGPSDHRMRPTTVNIMRHLYLRDMMVNNGDGHKPIWISEAAWNPVPTYDQLPLNPDGSDPIDAREVFGQVTPEQASEWMPDYYQRAQEEWGWIGAINYWFFTLASDNRRNESFYFMRMVEPDYSEEDPTFTPLPIYHTMRDYIATQTPTLYRGVHQVAGHWAIDSDENAEIVLTDGSLFDQALQTTEITFVANGTDMRIRWHGGDITINVDGESTIVNGHDGWNHHTFISTLTPHTHTITITSDSPIIIDAITVNDRSREKLFPIISTSIVLIMIGLGWMLMSIFKGQSL